jgi:hypothetical protein
MEKSVRTFETGATRDTNQDKLDPEGFLSHKVIIAYCEYMHSHRLQSDGRLRESDNWQKGIPRREYMKSLWRHFLDLWGAHRRVGPRARDFVTDTLCAIMFNTMGYLHAHLNSTDMPKINDDSEGEEI